MAKAGLHDLSQHMAMELADHNIRVNAASPAVVKTPIYESFIDPQEMDSALATFDNFHPIGRIGAAEDDANHNGSSQCRPQAAGSYLVYAEAFTSRPKIVAFRGLAHGRD